MRLLEERERRRSLGARPKELSPFNSGPSVTVQGSATALKASTTVTGATSSGKVTGEGLNTLSLLKELRMSEQSNSNKESNVGSRLRLRKNSSLDVDIFRDARKCIGLFPVKARHILDFHEGEYEICADDISQAPHLRQLAAEEFLHKN